MLVTLAIIGVVAALTIPTVVRNYQKQETVTKLKKAYSALSNTTNLAIADYGPIQTWEYYVLNQTDPITGKAGSQHFADRYLIPYLKVSRNCGTKADGECKYERRTLNAPNTKRDLSSSYARFYLNDGTFIAVTTALGGDGVSKYATISIDLNGEKAPNIMGKDIFTLQYTIYRNSKPALSGKFNSSYYSYKYPDSFTSTSYGACSKTASDQGGEGCAAAIMQQGWQITKDYPF